MWCPCWLIVKCTLSLEMERKGHLVYMKNELCLSVCCVTGLAWKEYLSKEKWPARSLPWPSSNFAGGKKALHSLSSSLTQWKWWTTLTPVEDYDLTCKSVAMKMCLTNLKEMVKAFCRFPSDKTGRIAQVLNSTVKYTAWLNPWTPTPPATSSSYYSGPNYPM